MDLSSLNVDVLLYLIKFVKPVDRFNLVLSGILKGFENAHVGLDLRKRYFELHFTCNVNNNCYLPRINCFEIKLGLRRGGTCELEIR